MTTKPKGQTKPETESVRIKEIEHRLSVLENCHYNDGLKKYYEHEIESAYVQGQRKGKQKFWSGMLLGLVYGMIYALYYLKTKNSKRADEEAIGFKRP